MSKQILFGGITLIILFGIVFLLIPEKDIPADKTPPEAPESLPSNPNTLKELLAEKTPVQCTFEGDASGMRIAGTIYVSTEKIRGDYLMTGTLAQDDMKTHMIMDSTSMWYWTESRTQGFKTSLNPKTLEPEKTDPSRVINYNQDFEYACTPWIIDSSKFIPPSTVSFIDLDNPISRTTSSLPPDSNAQQCAACDLVSDASGQAQCRAALRCN